MEACRVSCALLFLLSSTYACCTAGSYTRIVRLVRYCMYMAVQRWHHVAVQHVHCTCSCCYSTGILQRSETSTNEDACSLVPDKLITWKPDSHTGRVWPARAQTAARAEARKKFLCLTETWSMGHQTRLGEDDKTSTKKKQNQCKKVTKGQRSDKELIQTQESRCTYELM